MAAETLYNRLRATAQAFTESYNTAHATQDVTHITKTLTPDCRRYFSPASLFQLIPQLQDHGLSNVGFEEREAPNFASQKESKYSIEDITVDERERKVVIYAIRHAVFKDGRAYDFEQMNTLWMTDDGAKIKKIVQYIDTLLARQFLEETESGAKIKAFRE